MNYSVTVFGANGATGRSIVETALSRGYSVTAAVRRAKSLDLEHPRLSLSEYSFSDAASVEKAIGHSRAVISAIGLGGVKASSQPTTLYSDAIKAILAAQRSSEAKRLLVISSGGVEDNPHAPWFYRLLLRRYLINNYLDMVRMETLIETSGSDLDWTIIRPTYLLDGPSGPMQVRNRQVERSRFKIHRVDVAKFAVEQLEGREWVHRYPTLTYP